MKGIKPELIDDEKGKLFVGGLSWDTTQENLQRYFSRYGEVIDCVVMKNSESGRSRGFGFVTFADPSNVNIVLQNGPHQLDGRTIDPKACTPRSLQKKKGGNYPKVFLGGLPSNITETDLRSHFNRYGKVTEIVIMYDQEKKKSRGFGFLAFEDEESVDRCCLEHFINLGGKQIEIKRAETRDKNSSIDFTSAPWNQNPMGVGGMGIGAPNAPTMAGMGPGGMMPPGYQGWGSNPAPGYGYTAPSGPGGYQGWSAPAGPQAPPQWGSGYNAQQPGYGSYGPQGGPQTGYSSTWNWNMPQNGPVAGQTAPSQNDLYSRSTAAAPAGNIGVPQKNDYGSYGGYAGYQPDNTSFGATRNYNTSDVAQSGIMAGGGYNKPFDYKEWPAS